MENVWTKPSPWRSGGGKNPFNSPSARVWNDVWSSQTEDPDAWWNAWKQWTEPQRSTWQGVAESRMYDTDIYSFVERGYDGYGPTSGYANNPFAPRSTSTASMIGASIMSYIAREYPELYQFGGSTAGLGASSTANLGGNWSNVDQWNEEILRAQSQVYEQTGVFVPGNVIKAIMMIESQGIMPDGPNMAGAGGLMQVTPNSMGGSIYDYNRMNNDPAYSIWAGVNDLALRYQGAIAQDPSFNWSNAITGYFSGSYTPSDATDYYGTSAYLYQQRFNEYLRELDSAVIGGDMVDVGTGQLPNNGGPLFWAVTGGIPFPVTQEHGPTEWSQGGGAGMYTYAPYLGIEGHFGVDIGTPAGTQLFSPVDGVVLPQFDRTSYLSNVTGGPNNGGLYIQRPNGDIVILGHMYRIDVEPGTQVRAGQAVGISGSLNGDHVHLEYRKKEAHTTWNPFTKSYVSGDYRSVDPRLALNGIFTGQYSGGTIGGSVGAEYFASVDSWSDLMRATAQGKPINSWGSNQMNTFHDWIRTGMTNNWNFGGIGPSPGSRTIAGTWGVSFGQGNSWQNYAQQVQGANS